MNRVCFTLRVKPTVLEEYKAHHEQVWPEMLDALRRTGWHNYSLFLDDDGLLVGYFETPGTFEECLDCACRPSRSTPSGRNSCRRTSRARANTPIT